MPPGKRPLVTLETVGSLKKETKAKECGLTWPACPQGAGRMQVGHEKSLAGTHKPAAQ